MSKHAPPSPAPDETLVLRLGQAAQLLDVSTDTLYQMVRAGEIPHARVGNSIRIRRADLDAHLAARTSTTWARVDGRGRPRRTASNDGNASIDGKRGA